ncbi:MAG TPA: glycosyltransferase family 2 protein [Candidatus Dormibacteraeota bacterium]
MPIFLASALVHGVDRIQPVLDPPPAVPGTPELAGRTVMVVMPAYNAAKTLAQTWQAIPKEWIDRVILVDDGSRDETVQVAEQLHLHVIRHPHNVGYGGNQKTCYMEALRLGADVVVMLHPDGQYDPTLLPDLVKPILAGDADFVLGSRFAAKDGPKKGGMPLYKRLANRFLTMCENLALGSHFSELHTGYRAYSRRFLETVPFLRNSNDFVFDTEVIAQAVTFGFKVAEVPVETRYFPEASSANLRQSLTYGFKTLWIMAKHLANRLHVGRSKLFRR